MVPVKFTLLINRSEMEHQYILHTRAPYQLGLLHFFSSSEDYTAWSNSGRELAFAQVPGYKIAVSYWGTLAGHYLPAAAGAIAEVQELMEEMARMYLESEIYSNRLRFVKYLFQI